MQRSVQESERGYDCRSSFSNIIKTSLTCPQTIINKVYDKIGFVALKVYKELERLLKASHSPYSIDDVLRIAETIVTVEIARPENNDTFIKTLCITNEEKDISYLIESDDCLNL